MFADTRPLKHPHYRRLWTAQIITTIGAQLTVVSVPAQLWAITHDSGMVGLTGIFGLVPLLLFGLWGGAIADSFDRRRVLLVSTIGLVVASFGFFVQAALGMHNVWLILGPFSIQQAFFAVTAPARSAILPSLVDSDELPAANALNTTVFLFGGIAGPLIGGMLIPLLGYSLLYLLDALCLTATLYAVFKLPPMMADGATGQRPSLRNIIDGLLYLKGHHVLLMSFVVDLIAMVFGMPRALFPQIANLDFHGPAEGGRAFGWLMAAMPIGGFIGGVMSGWVSRVQRQGLAVLVSVMVWGLAMAGFGASVVLAQSPLWFWLTLACFAMGVGGAADTASAAFRSTMLQQAAGDEVRGRLQGVFFIVVVGGPRVADVVHGYAAKSIGAGPASLWGGVAVVVGTALCWALSRPFREYRPDQHSAPAAR